MIIFLISLLFTTIMIYSLCSLVKVSCYLMLLLNVAIISFKLSSQNKGLSTPNKICHMRRIDNEIQDFVTSSKSAKFEVKWVDCQGDIDDTDDVISNLGNQSFKLVTYNVLGPLHGESSKHSYSPEHITKWTRRRDKLIEELRLLSSDILCLQEVSYKSLKETYVPGLNRVGLQCAVFAPAKIPEKSRGGHGHKQIGCAIFTHQSKFSVIGTKTIYLRDFAGIDHSVSQNFKYDVKGRYNSLALACLQVKSTKELFIVANTHLFWDPNRADIKTIQTAALIRAIAHFNNVVVDCVKRNQTLSKSVDQNIVWPKPDKIPQFLPVILAGDFNTFLDMENDEGDSGFISTSLVELLTNGVLDKTHPQHPDSWVQERNNKNLLDAWGNKNPPELNPRVGNLVMPTDPGLKFQNVYTSEEFSVFRPLFTTKTDEFQGWIDHIWTNKFIHVHQVLKPPILASDLEANIKARSFTPIPNQFYASDHIPLGVYVSLNTIENNDDGASSIGSMEHT